MVYPSLQQVVAYSRDYDVIPVCQTFLADTETPISLFQKLNRSTYAFLLESVEGDTKRARYSFIGTDPSFLFTAKDGCVFIRNEKGEEVREAGPPLEMLQRFVGKRRSPAYDGFPPFLGGGVGYVGYECLSDVRGISAPESDPLHCPDVQFMFCDRLLVFDHLERLVIAVKLLYVPRPASLAELTKAYEATLDELNRWIRHLEQIPSVPSPLISEGIQSDGIVPHRSNMTKATYMDKVKQAKQLITQGEVQQVVLSQRLEVDLAVDPFHVYRVLRSLNPSPYMFYLQLGKQTIVGSSPEMLVRVNGGVVETRPIAGTRRRAASKEEDERLAQELLQDSKEVSEHMMLVELGKEEIARVCESDSVELKQLMVLERYSHVMHLVSHVSGRLRTSLSPFDALVSCMPAGTVSGAPKDRAMEIIAELEAERRGPYAGGVGYISYSGNLDTCITIRSILFKNGKAYVQAGGGIVADSVPEKEYEESMNKARATLTALALAKEMLQSHVV